MNLRKIFLPAVVLMAVTALVAAPVLANCGKDHGSGAKMCPMKKGGDQGMSGSKCKMGGSKCKMGNGKCAMKSRGMEKPKCPVTARFTMLAHELLENKAVLGLTAEEVAKVRALKLEVAKGYLRQSAEMQIFMLDMNSRLSKDEIDVEEFESFIDSGMAGMATAAKASVKAYADLRSIATPERMAKLKAGRHSAAAIEPDHAH